jgi:glucose-6-phosphate isomerase
MSSACIKDYRFAMWDWVGGRYSIWSAIGVSLAIAIGRAGFRVLSVGRARSR